jgi:outer membrane biosynthesis protein TonB
VSTRLRTSLIWHDEVMEDLVLDSRGKVTLGTRCVRPFPWAYALKLLGIGVVIGLLCALWALADGPLAGIVPILAATFRILWHFVWNRRHRSGLPTFIVPNIGVPDGFGLIRPGNRGHLLTLGEHMRGTICIDGREKDVAELVEREGSGGFCATAIGGRDWGVIDLDPSGHYQVFFQFTTVDDPPQFFTKPVLIAGGAGYLISCLALTLLWLFKDVGAGEAAFRGVGMSSLAMLIGGVAWALLRQDGESQASFAFSIVLHAALLFMTYQLYDGENPFVWPGPRSLAGNYLVTRLDKEEPPEPKPVPTVSGKVQGAAAATKDPPKNTATKGDEGHQGGKGDTERARDPNAKDAPVEAPKIELMTENNRKVYQALIDVDRNLQTSLNKFNVLKGDKPTSGSLGFGTGTGTGVGPGVGTGTRGDSKKGGSGGGGNVEGDFVSSGKIDTGTNRPGGGNCKGGACGAGPKAINVAFSEPSGDFGGLTSEEIDRVVKARAGVFRACYQKELNHTPGIGGKLIIHFKIGGDGSVQAGNTAKAGGSTLSNDTVEQCIKSNVNRLKFPAKGGIANVNYPFVFTQGG